MSEINAYQEVLNISKENDRLMEHIGLVKRVALHLKTRLPKTDAGGAGNRGNEPKDML